MPLYATRCRACDNHRDVLVRSNTAPLPLCSRELADGEPCEGRLEKLLAAPSFNLTGSGWYKPGPSR